MAACAHLMGRRMPTRQCHLTERATQRLRARVYGSDVKIARAEERQRLSRQLEEHRLREEHGSYMAVAKPKPKPKPRPKPRSPPFSCDIAALDGSSEVRTSAYECVAQARWERWPWHSTA